jgi:DNA-binding NarL/FixJ family response regulator
VAVSGGCRPTGLAVTACRPVLPARVYGNRASWLHAWVSGLSDPGRPVRVVLADDNVLLREGVAGLLERAGFEIAGKAGDAGGLIALVRAQSPDLAVVDIRMPPDHSTEGLDAALTIRKEFPEIGIVLLSAFVHAEHAVGLLSSGKGIGYLLKDRVEDVTEFAQSLRRIADGGVVIDPDLVQDLVRGRQGDDRLDVLSAREREVLALMAEGRSNAGSPGRSGSPGQRWRSTCTAFSASSTFRTAPMITGECWPCWPT